LDTLTFSAYDTTKPTALPAWITFDGINFTIDPDLPVEEKTIVLEADDAFGKVKMK